MTRISTQKNSAHAVITGRGGTGKSFLILNNRRRGGRVWVMDWPRILRRGYPILDEAWSLLKSPPCTEVHNAR